MKKQFQIIGVLTLIWFSFFCTERTIFVIKNNDDIMIKINEEKEKYNTKSTDSIIIKDTIIPGLSGNIVNEEIQKELEFAKYIKPTVSQNIGVVNGNVFGNIEGDVINNYNNSQKPKETNNSTYYLTDRFNEYCPIQIVKSYDVTRDICNIENESNGPVIKAKITMPEKVKQLPGCQFAMILLSFTPFINLENYYDENYNLEFSLDTSQSIKLVQFQIKNVQQSQFIDFPLENKHHIIPLAKMSSRDSWKEIKEICFTVFADDRYITDEIGYIKISGLRLTK